jgi:L-fuconolactonase
MLDFPLIDTHLHIWDPGLLRYPWLDGNALLNKPYFLPDYTAATAAERVEKMVFVQCEATFDQFLQEAEWVASQPDPRIAGIVAWAPLENGDAARPDLDKLAAIPRVKGIRRIIQFEPDIGFCLRPGFVQGVQALADYDLSFDICVNHAQMENTVELVRQCPDVRFILDHIGKPDIKNHLLDPWRAHITTLASMDNVWCKVSGMVTEADTARWTPNDLKPYLDHVLDSFGFNRVVFGGDYPVVLGAAPWQRWVDTLVGLLQARGTSSADLRALFHDNAAAFYRLT